MRYSAVNVTLTSITLKDHRQANSPLHPLATSSLRIIFGYTRHVAIRIHDGEDNYCGWTPRWPELPLRRDESPQRVVYHGTILFISSEPFKRGKMKYEVGGGAWLSRIPEYITANGWGWGRRVVREANGGLLYQSSSARGSTRYCFIREQKYYAAPYLPWNRGLAL